MFCVRCGSQCADEAQFCPYCGESFASPQAPNWATQAMPAAAGPMWPAHVPQQKKKGRGAIVAAIVVVAVLVLAGAAFALTTTGVLGASGNDEGQDSQVAATQDQDDAGEAMQPSKQLSIVVQQIDATAFPKIKAYLEITDADSGEVPEALDSGLFYLERQDANAGYVKQTITSVNQLNEEEALIVDLVADLSGSMEGQPLEDAQDVMCEFVDSMQFDAGDKAELTSFSTGVRLEQEFTDDADVLKDSINAFRTSDMTSLYDALYTAVERVAARGGARCVIAFTDGQDNNSSVTIEDVEEVAQRYQIPIFIIGVGDVDYTDVADLAEACGGAYYNVDATISMHDIYQQIYKSEKSLYLLEYEDESGASANDVARIRIGYGGDAADAGDSDGGGSSSVGYTGSCDYEYTPYVLTDVQSEGIFDDGPEAAVEGYLKNWAPSITNKDYARISPYIAEGSKLERTQRKYVQKGYEEELDSYEITDTTYSDDDNCTVSTRETFYVQYPNKTLQLMTQVVTYSLVCEDDEWKLTDIVSLDVPIRINQ